VRKSKNQKITFRFSVLSTSPLMASVIEHMINAVKRSLPTCNSGYSNHYYSIPRVTAWTRHLISSRFDISLLSMETGEPFNNQSTTNVETLIRKATPDCA